MLNTFSFNFGRCLGFGALVFLLHGCASLESTQSPSAYQAAQLSFFPNPKPNSKEEGLNAQLLNKFLVAEIAGQRDDLALATSTYSELAVQTQNSAVAQRATWVAQYARDAELSQVNAVLWAQLEPNNAQAQGAAAGFLIQNDQHLEALDYLIAYDHLGGRTNYTLLAKRLDEQENPELTAIYQRLAAEERQRQTPNPDLLSALALLSFALDQMDTSQKYIHATLAAAPKNLVALQLQVQLYLYTNQTTKAYKFLQQTIRQHPQESSFQFELARLQLEQGQIQAGEATFAKLMQDNPRSNLRLNWASVQIEHQLYANAEQNLRHLINHPQFGTQALVFLGELAQRQQHWQQAIDYYTQALATLDTTSSGEAHRTLYSRALAYYQLDDFYNLEQDLRQILANDPHNSTALNALGYTLVNKTERLEEGLELIQQALTLQPEAPEILDSYGWALYKLGRFNEALEYLEQAYHLYPDAEVLEHLQQVQEALQTGQE